MKDRFTIEGAVAKLSLAAGDVLVVKCDADLTQHMADQVRANLAPLLPVGVKMMVLGKDITLSVLSKSDIEDRTA